jgi:hypothetical protein
MDASGPTLLQIAFSTGFVVFTSYTGGRVHQWHRDSLERERAYCRGFNQATRRLFLLAIGAPHEDR